MSLLFGEHVQRIAINDADSCIYAMWSAILDDTERFVARIERCRLTIAAWRRHRSVYQCPERHSAFDVGFSTFFLNRCNRSGIIANGGPIGGIDQCGRWKIDARFNREALVARVRRIAEYRSRISVSNLDALDFLRGVAAMNSAVRYFVYLDPPYYEKGRALYLNYYIDSDHTELANYLVGDVPFAWVLSYDNVGPIRKLYRGLRRAEFNLDYHARERRVGKELLVVKEGLEFPPKWSRRIPPQYVSAAVDAVPA